MAKEKFINGKRDDAKHDGRASNVRREQQADYELQQALTELAIQEAARQQSQKGQAGK